MLKSHSRGNYLRGNKIKTRILLIKIIIWKVILRSPTQLDDIDGKPITWTALITKEMNPCIGVSTFQKHDFIKPWNDNC